jgi:hypothetical protein
MVIPKAGDVVVLPFPFSYLFRRVVRAVLTDVK